MCTLRPPFDANSLQCLAMKIVKGTYSSIPNIYSKDLKSLITLLLNRDPNKRPRIHQILNMDLIKNRIKDFLTKTVSLEFNHTVIHKKDLYKIASEEEKLEKIKNNNIQEDLNSYKESEKINVDKEREKAKEREREREIEREKNKEKERLKEIEKEKKKEKELLLEQERREKMRILQ